MFGKKTSKPKAKKPKAAKKPEIVKPAAPVAPIQVQNTYIVLGESDIPAFKEMLEIASAGIAPGNVRILVEKLKSQLNRQGP
jgi:ribulose 1,5-bisphosphate carboxylase large subunit-like protein